jgi:hypothetical protein
MSADCLLKTTVKNISGSTRRFSFLPPLGVSLANNQEFTAPGTINDWCKRTLRSSQPDRLRREVEHALEEGWIEIISTPVPFLRDETADSTHVIGVDDGEFLIKTPCYVSPESSTVIGPA